MLGALAVGATLEQALAPLGVTDVSSAGLAPRAVPALLSVCPAPARGRCAEWMLSALRPRASAPRAATHPTGLFLGGAITMALGTIVGRFVAPVFAEIAGTEVVDYNGAAVTLLAGLAMVLGVVGIARASRGMSARALAETGLLGVMTLDDELLARTGLPIPRRMGEPAGLDALLGWLGAASVAGVTGEKLLQRIPTPAMGQASAQRLWSEAKSHADVMSVVRAWARQEPVEVQNVAVRLEGEDELAVLERVRRVALTVDRTNHLGAVISALGFALLVAAVFMAVHPIILNAARFGVSIV
ncbi:MAG: hypothetical protein RIT81_00655 [Deltaproteobacteria bacterium]